LSQVQATSGDGAARKVPAEGPIPWDWNRILTVTAVLYMLPVIVLTAALYWKHIVGWEHVWRTNSAWGHGYLIPVIAVVIAHFRLKELNPQRIQPSIWGLALILTGLVLRVWCEMLRFGYPGALTFLLVVAGLVLLALGRDMFKVLLVPVAFMVLMIPLDLKYYESMALPLQKVAAMGAERVLPLFGYKHFLRDSPLFQMEFDEWRRTAAEYASYVYRDGTVLFTAGTGKAGLSVAGACAGLHLLFAFVALGVMMAYIYRHPLWERIVIMASSVPIAVFCNMVRIALMGLVSDKLAYEIDRANQGAPTWSEHMPGFFWQWLTSGADVVSRLTSLRDNVLDPSSMLHQGFGFLMFGVAIVLMWVELWIIDRFYVDDEKTGPAGAAGPGQGPQAPAAGKA
jgi:exosortase/archaeosortase family protein